MSSDTADEPRHVSLAGPAITYERESEAIRHIRQRLQRDPAIPVKSGAGSELQLLLADEAFGRRKALDVALSGLRGAAASDTPPHRAGALASLHRALAQGAAAGGPEADACEDLLEGPLLGQVATGALEEQRDAAQAPSDWDSHHEFFEEVLALLARLNSVWLQRFNEVLSNYVSVFDKLTEVMTKLKDAIKGHDKDGNLTVNFFELRKALRELADEIATGPGLGGAFDSEEEAKEFLKELGVDGLLVKQDGNGKWELALDPQLIRDLVDVFPAGAPILRPIPDPPYFEWVEADIKMNPARYNAIIAAKDSLMERFNHLNRVLPDKHQHQIQWWNTVLKALSATIDELSQADRQIVQNMT
ncbi:hypothetical protein [Stenotrophomonas tumulicola]|uniref:EF-hand domain-containing protein n=1 Tax=Stenotrophomonas tumulicola TaxID=1685415 RepID=A0A7W3FM27_9GAMM|nr:hypothetical protein [Stenotrophomonas tumulicola]MBA8682067.1 hypothetical protein [Stenotrophomonas tumulicola]